ncbi:MAG: hypothetical protein O3A84_04375 [Proteobacteria bacterium]|nr:hypothetical protein [Pseudomonadota bacterium]
MKFGVIAGFVLLGMAFIAAAAEMAALALSGSVTYVSAYTTLTALLPNQFGAVEAFVVKHIHPLVWDPVIRTLFLLPGWLLLGLPGTILAWKCRPSVDQVDDGDDDQLPYETEYVPRCAAVPGFKRLRRYLSMEGDRRHILMHEFEDDDGLRSQAWQDLRTAEPFAICDDADGAPAAYRRAISDG